MRRNLPTLRGLLFLSLLLGISIISINIVTALKTKETQLQNYKSYLTQIPTSIPVDVLTKIKNREEQLRMSIEEFEKEQNLYTPQNTPPENITPTPPINPTTTPQP